jgi:hypothetical protein
MKLAQPGDDGGSPDRAHLLPGTSVELRSRLPPPDDEVGDWHDPGGADDGHRRGPQPLGSSDLAGWPPLDVDERRQLEDAFDNCRDAEQSAGARAELAPLFLVAMTSSAWVAGIPDGLHLT